MGNKNGWESANIVLAVTEPRATVIANQKLKA
jgi:hypothetical protein